MAPKFVRRALSRLDLLDSARAIKKKIVGQPQWSNFKPADPRTQIATLKCFHWLQERDLLRGTDYFEFGIFRGFNLWFLQAYARSIGLRDMRFIGFDSFFGLPPSEGIDSGGPFHEGDFSSYREEVETYFNRFGVDWEQTRLVQGFFDKSLAPESIAKYGLRNCALCTIDCDLYSSTVPVLEYVRTRLTDVAILYFDDWEDYGSDELKGEPKAFAEFCTTYANEFEIEPFEDLIALGGKGKAFILRRKR